MYHQYFGLQEAPFSIAVNPRYLFMSARHRDALAHLLYGVGAGGGFILLTGEVGTGKTTINRALLEQLPENTDVAIILNPALNALELLASVCDELGIGYDPDSHTLKTLTDKLHTFLLDNHARGRNTVLMIDEAQHLDFDVLEQIRLLTNLETNNRKLLQIILIGQPELAQLLGRPELRQLSQRITARYNLEPLNLEETRAYIRHRLAVAGAPPDREVFPDAVVKQLFRRTRGIPRLINVLCDRILLGAYGQNKLQADKQMLQVAAREVLGDEPASRGTKEGHRLGWPAVAAVLVLALAAVALLRWRESATPAAIEPVVAGQRASAGAAYPVDEPQPQTSQSPSWLLPPAAAMAQLWSLVSVDPMPEGLCSREQPTALVCVTERADTWDDLAAFDRPLLLDMVSPERYAASVLVLDMGDRSALVYAGGAVKEVALSELAPLWRGGFRFLWQPPAGFSAPLSIGSSGEVVGEVARLFARLDGQDAPLAQRQFNAALKQRVVMFQRNHGLEDDGVVGRQTLLKLNELLGIDITSDRALGLLQRSVATEVR